MFCEQRSYGQGCPMIALIVKRLLHVIPQRTQSFPQLHQAIQPLCWIIVLVLQPLTNLSLTSVPTFMTSGSCTLSEKNTDIPTVWHLLGGKPHNLSWMLMHLKDKTAVWLQTCNYNFIFTSMSKNCIFVLNLLTKLAAAFTQSSIIHLNIWQRTW